MNNLFLGLLIVVTAAFLQGSFAVPMSYARNWKWENSWMIFSIFGMIVFNLLFSLISIPNLIQVYQSASLSAFLVPLIFGLIFGISAVSFGLGIAAVGFALGYAIMLGLLLGVGTFIPMVVLHPEEILTTKGILILIGLLVTLVGIGLSAFAGIRKEREQGGKTGEITRIAKISLKIGILLCIINGLCGSAINIGFSMSRSLLETAIAHGAHENWAGNAIWAVLFTSGGILNILYCGYQIGANKTAKNYKAQGSLKNLIFILVMSVMWIGSFILYGVGATMMGNWGTVIGWSVYMALSIAVANLWGIFQGEWSGASRKTKMLMAQGLLILLCAIVIFSYSGTI